MTRVYDTTMRTFPKVVDGVLGFYTEVIEYDRNNMQIGETKILSPIYTMGFSDGSPVTEQDVKRWEK